MRRLPFVLAVAAAALGLAGACPFDNTLRAYLHVNFWLPFAKGGSAFARPDVSRVSVAYAGMTRAAGASALDQLRKAYQEIAAPNNADLDTVPLRRVLAEARATPGLNGRQREELDLIDAKIDMRAGHADRPKLLESARAKLQDFLRRARTPEYRSEARGWLAYVHFLLGNQTAAGKLYLDELNREGSNLSRETLLVSLRRTYGYSGGEQLLEHLDEYFDTPEHATFAIQLVTNPQWERGWVEPPSQGPSVESRPVPYARIQKLLEMHAGLFRGTPGSTLLLLGMRTALRAGDPAGALRLALAAPAQPAVQRDPDYLWMLASAHFLSRDYAGAERPLQELFRSLPRDSSRRAAAAYGLCGVYQKLQNPAGQLRFALWLWTTGRESGNAYKTNTYVGDLSVYWAASGWDLSLMLEDQAPTEVLEAFIRDNPQAQGIRLVKYALAVRLTREQRYDEAAAVYQEIGAVVRAPRLRRLAALAHEAERQDQGEAERLQARFRLAQFISDNPNRIFFNDSLWSGLQRYAMISSEEGCYTRQEREAAIARERKLKDDQEELWRAYRILRDVAAETADPTLRRSAVTLGLRCLRGLSERFGREAEIRKADIELSALLCN